jgi:hypothetical protein
VGRPSAEYSTFADSVNGCPLPFGPLELVARHSSGAVVRQDFGVTSLIESHESARSLLLVLRPEPAVDRNAFHCASRIGDDANLVAPRGRYLERRAAFQRLRDSVPAVVPGDFGIFVSMGCTTDRLEDLASPVRKRMFDLAWESATAMELSLIAQDTTEGAAKLH